MHGKKKAWYPVDVQKKTSIHRWVDDVDVCPFPMDWMFQRANFIIKMFWEHPLLVKNMVIKN